MMFYGLPTIYGLDYVHRPIDEEIFIFPITGLRLKNNELSIGCVKFVRKNYVRNNLKNKNTGKKAYSSTEFNKKFKNINTFAIVELNKLGEYENKCEDGSNSLALQVLEQTIGAIYLSIYNKKERADDEKRIIISDKGFHEVDEGLNSYMAIGMNGYDILSTRASEGLIANENDFDIDNISGIIDILNKKIQDRTKFENKLCKSLEIIYGTFIESHAIDRVIKFVIILNYLFREDDNQKFKSNFIGRKLKIIFNTIDNKKIIELLPDYLHDNTNSTKKVSALITDIFSRIRNNVMHGKLELFKEYAILNTKDLIPLKVITMELIDSILSNEYLLSSKSTKEFNERIEKKEEERIKLYRDKAKTSQG